MEDDHTVVFLVQVVTVAKTIGLAVVIYYICRAISSKIVKKKTNNKKASTNNDGFKQKHGDDDDDDVVSTTLLGEECMRLECGHPSMTTITWYEFKKEQDINVVAKHFEQRIDKILQANPWLLGRFVRGSRRKQYSMVYSIKTENNPFSLSNVFKIVSDPNDCPISSDAKIIDNFMICQQAGIHPRGSKIDSKFQEPFWRVTMIPSCKVSNQFALVVCLSHVVGDGYTFYQIYKPLISTNKNEPIPSLETKRIETSCQEYQDLMGKEEASMTASQGFIGSLLRGTFMRKVYGPLTNTTSKYTHSNKFFLVDMDKICELKEEHVQNPSKTVPFVTTNDIITSWFLSKLPTLDGKGMNHGFVATNLRGHIPSHTMNHVGNYIGHIYYKLPQDTATPSLIHQSISQKKRIVTTNEPISHRRWIFRESTCVVTNVASIYPRGCKGATATPIPTKKGKESLKDDNDDSSHLGFELNELFHLPYFVEETLPPTILYCMIFMARSSTNQLGIQLTGAPDIVNCVMEDCPFLLSDSLESLAG